MKHTAHNKTQHANKVIQDVIAVTPVPTTFTHILTKSADETDAVVNTFTATHNTSTYAYIDQPTVRTTFANRVTDAAGKKLAVTDTFAATHSVVANNHAIHDT